jgi:hypothetical protein
MLNVQKGQAPKLLVAYRSSEGSGFAPAADENPLADG